MLGGFRKRLAVAVWAGGVFLVGLFGTGCGSAEDPGPLGDPAADENVFSTESELRFRAWRWRTRTTSGQPTSTGTTTTTTTTTPNTTPTTTPTGVVDSSNSGGICPNNRAMPEGGACGPYGVNCTYSDGSGTHYCHCLNSGPSGVQGWSCR